MSQSTAGERATAALSALAALLILGAAVTADHSDSVPSSRLAALESDLRFQLNLVHRLNGQTLKARLADVDHTLSAWRDSPQSGDDYRLLVAWLEASIDRSLPGESGELPTTPKFGAAPAPIAAAPPATAPAPTTAPATQLATPATASPPPARPQLHPAPPIAAAPKPQPAKQSTPPAPIQSPPTTERPITVHNPTPPASPASAERVPTPTPAPAPAPATQPTPAALASVAAKPVEINFAELNSRIAGYHQGLKAIESTLVADREHLTQERLAEVVERLEQLANQYGFVSLYYDTLSDRERRAVTAPRPLTATVELVQRQLARLEHGGEADVLSAFEAPTPDDSSSLAARLQAIAEQTSDTASAR